MREIKFRAKTLSHGFKIGFIGYIKDPYEPYIFWTEYVDNEPFTRKDYVYKDTIGQFTGLKDKNGKEIYEGDIIRFSTEKIEVVEWKTDRLGFGFRGNEWRMLEDDGMNSEVIGNIHENPELRENRRHCGQ